MSKTRRIAEPENARWQAFFRGEITVQDMDDAELARAQFRSGDGSFRGRPPKTVPREFAQQVSRELLSRQDSRIRQVLSAVTIEVARIALEGEKETDRLRAANMIWERAMGKVAEKIEVSEERKPWEEHLAHVVGESGNVVSIRRGRRVRPKEE
jgi:hypothetical protein